MQILELRDGRSVELLDLRDVHDEKLLQAAYEGLYCQSFPVADEREEPADWVPRLWGGDRDGQAFLHAFIAGSQLTEAEPRIAGLLFFEFFCESASGLLSYLAVDPAFRRTGLGRELVIRGIETLHEDAATRGAALTGVYAEIHDPDRLDYDDAMDPAERVSFFAKLNARLVPIPYVQPALHDGKARVTTLQLIALPRDREEAARPWTLPGDDVRHFLHALYVSLGVEHPEKDRDFRLAAAALDGDGFELKPLNAVPERPALSIATYGIAFHFVTRDPPEVLPRASEQFASFERDLLSYSYRDDPPFSSTAIHVPAPCRQIEVQFSRELRFVSEGRTCTLFAEDAPWEGQPPKRVQIRASKTRFRSGLTVWHLVLTPRADGVGCELTEYDLIKLEKLWEGGEAVTGPYEGEGPERCVRFLGATETWTLRELARKVLERDSLAEQRPRAGTLELITDARDRARWRELWRAVGAACEERGVDASIAYRDEEQRRQAVAVGGVIQGLVDFEQIDDSELREVFSAMDVGEDGVSGLHKGSLLYIGARTRAFDAGARSFGTSPYLLLPQALLLHDEETLRRAVDAADEADRARRLDALERCIRTMRRALEHDYLPNVFHYPAEREIVDRGFESRGLVSLQREVEARLSETRARWEQKADRRRGIADDVRNGLLLVLSYTAFRELPGVEDWQIILGLCVITVVYLAWRWGTRVPY